MRRIILSLALLFCVSAGDILAQTPKSTPARFVRVVVLDVSSSMKGPNLGAAKREIQDNASQLPPSSQYPLVIIPFHSAVDRVHRFTDLVAVRTFLTQLQANGGTSIASGLSAAIKELKPYQNVRHVCVMLYTDGEDSDQRAIALEEGQLDRLFVERNKQGLKQTVVFCKRWQNANAGLVSKISKRGNARVVDAGELRVVPITLVPDFKAIDVQ